MFRNLSFSLPGLLDMEVLTQVKNPMSSSSAEKIINKLKHYQVE